MFKILNVFAFALLCAIWLTIGMYFWLLLMVFVILWVIYLAVLNIVKRPYSNIPSFNNILHFAQNFWVNFIMQAYASFFKEHTISFTESYYKENQPISIGVIKIIFAFAIISFVGVIYWLIKFL
jgi:hypothetical protein